MKQLMLGLALLFASAAAWTGAPCCVVIAIDARTAIVTIKDLKTDTVTEYQADLVGIKGLKVGAKVDLVDGQLRTATGYVIPNRTQP
ncbi:MAG: hypothetical protein WDZ66_11625 [Steroidobacteraceae bacterium]